MGRRAGRFLNFSDALISGIFIFFFLAVNAKPNQLDYATDLYLTPLSPFYCRCSRPLIPMAMAFNATPFVMISYG
jgi:hypothetical protein